MWDLFAINYAPDAFSDNKLGSIACTIRSVNSMHFCAIFVTSFVVGSTFALSDLLNSTCECCKAFASNANVSAGISATWLSHWSWFELEGIEEEEAKTDIWDWMTKINWRQRMSNRRWSSWALDCCWWEGWKLLMEVDEGIWKLKQVIFYFYRRSSLPIRYPKIFCKNRWKLHNGCCRSASSSSIEFR